MGKKTSDGPNNIKLRCIEMLNNIDFFVEILFWIIDRITVTLSVLRPILTKKRLISEQGVKKQAFHILQDYYSFI